MHAADSKHPAADIASQSASALALLSKWFEESAGSSKADKEALAPLLATKAKHAYEYAVDMGREYGFNTSTCSNSKTKDNCQGDCSMKKDLNKGPLYDVRTLALSCCRSPHCCECR